MAASLVDGAVNQSSFDAGARARLAAVRSKVSVHLSSGIDAAYPAAWGTELAVQTADGRSFAAVRRHAKGDPENPVTAAEMAEKARMLLSNGGLDRNRAEALIGGVLALPDDAPVRALGIFPQDKGYAGLRAS